MNNPTVHLRNFCCHRTWQQSRPRLHEFATIQQNRAHPDQQKANTNNSMGCGKRCLAPSRTAHHLRMLLWCLWSPCRYLRTPTDDILLACKSTTVDALRAGPGNTYRFVVSASPRPVPLIPGSSTTHCCRDFKNHGLFGCACDPSEHPHLSYRRNMLLRSSLTCSSSSVTSSFDTREMSSTTRCCIARHVLCSSLRRR